jgi:hypothetical protein
MVTLNRWLGFHDMFCLVDGPRGVEFEFSNASQNATATSPFQLSSTQPHRYIH